MLLIFAFLWSRVCACCSTEADQNEIKKTEYKIDDVLFRCLSTSATADPVLAIPEHLRWNYNEPDACNKRLGRYKLRLCTECKRTLKQNVVPANSVFSIPLNHFYGRECLGRHLSEDLISVHKQLFAGMSYVTRSLLALIKPIITVITVSFIYLHIFVMYSLVHAYVK